MEGERRFASVSIPRINELRCVIGRVEPNTKTIDSSVESLYHFRILKCRSLIHSLSEIIASPGIIGSRWSDPSEIYILTKSEFLYTGKIQGKLDDMNIKYSDPMEVTPQVYKECLVYTMLSKLSPKWNKVEKYLLAGEDFLDSISAPTKAVILDIVIDGEDTRLAVSPACVTVPAPLGLSHFSLSSRIVKNFLTDDGGFIQLDNSQAQTWVFVLPSLKKGRVVSISKEIPKSCPFADYEQLRSHWNNMYGYQLPGTALGLIYYQLNFPGLGSGSFTYPSCCVSSGKLDLLRLSNGDDVARQFFNDLTETARSICGTEFKTEEIQPQDRQKINQKENIYRREFGTPYDYLSGNLYSGSIGRKALSTISNSPAEVLNPKHNARGKSLQEVLSMKPFLQFQSANKKYLAPFSNEFISVVESKRLSESSNTSGVASASSGQVKAETNPDEVLKSDLENEDSLRRRSSFDLNDFIKTSDPSEGILIRDLKPEVEKSSHNEHELVEVKSRYFENLGQVTVEKDAKERVSSSKLKFHRLSSRKSKLRGADFKTKDISSYFRETKNRVKVSEVNGIRTAETPTSVRLVQTHLNFLKRSEAVESCVESKKIKSIE